MKPTNVLVVTVIYMSRLVLVLVFRLQPSVVDEFHFPGIGSEKLLGTLGDSRGTGSMSSLWNL